MKHILISAVLVLSYATAAHAAADATHPCEQIKQTCENAGFVKGDAKQGFGLWVDCIDPIIRGTAQPKKAIKPLPTIDPSLVAACKTKNPKFGEPKSK